MQMALHGYLEVEYYSTGKEVKIDKKQVNEYYYKVTTGFRG